MDLNKAMVIGRVTQKPEKKMLQSGQGVTSFSIASNRRWKDNSGQQQEQAEFHNVVAWGKLADICEQYLNKGGRVYIEGRLQTRSWEGKDGVKRYRTEIIANNMIMLDSKGAGSAAPSQSTGGGSSYGDDIVVEPISEASSEQEINVDNIPF